ncbi:MAG: Na(+)/H(+) antiporter [uncultured Nocardioidaceae bacterium]|uniref:Na(+)/H(+) antiporter n=1 Tax=uncultured Nocardioidaceae bacterium TaxID=253824 RepID=A0A6J4MHM8_9ACTN|nr:MAG: Na(+)/H(+) antiporter [uncultured Nocardioidaceae bacterium]
MNFDLEQFDAVLLLASAVVLVSILAVRMSVRAGLPSLLVYLLLGVLLGESGAGIGFENADLAHALGFGALVVILSEGGLTTNWKEIRPAMRTGGLLATLGVAVGVSLMAVLAHVVLGFDWQTAVIIAAVTAPTDAAAVFSVLRRLPLPRRLTGALEAESGLNDAPTVLLVTLASQGDLLDSGVPELAARIVMELGGGVLVGAVGGFGGAWLLRRAALPSSGLYPLAVLSLCVLSYAGAAALHTSGFAAVYTAALILGNSELPHRAATRSFAEGLGWLSQIGLFVMLGLLLSPGRIDGASVLQAVVAGGLLTLVVRPVSVALSTVWQRLSLVDMAFLSWAGLRGAVPIVLSTIPLSEGVPGATRIFDVVFVLVVIDTIITGPTLPWVARRLGLTEAGEMLDLDIESAPMERLGADLLQIRITRRSRMHGVEVGELRLPQGASVALIVREGQTLVPVGSTVLLRGDDLLVVTPRTIKDETEQRLRAVSLRGRLAHWLE